MYDLPWVNVDAVDESSTMTSLELEQIAQLNLEWPGWPLSNNPFGDEFDAAARVRMIANGRRLAPYILGHKARLGPSWLEIGPFFNPLSLLPELGPLHGAGDSLMFLENDPHAVAWLREKHQATVLALNMNDAAFFEAFKSAVFERTGSPFPTFDVLLISQVLNYVDFRKLLSQLYPCSKPGALVFINDAPDYGIPQLFSASRPANNDEIVAAVSSAGFSIVEKAYVPNLDRRGNVERLIVVARKSNLT